MNARRVRKTNDATRYSKVETGLEASVKRLPGGSVSWI